MHKILQDKQLDKIQDVEKWYYRSVSDLEEAKRDKIFGIHLEIDRKWLGWQSFENGRSSRSNPFVQDVVNAECDFNWWKLGYEMARQYYFEMALQQTITTKELNDNLG